MLRQYCTYFDHRYLSRALAMVRSLRRVEPDARIWALCMSDQAYNYFRSRPEPGVHPIALSELESGDEELLQAKGDGRSAIEYYFTCSPSLVRYAFRLAPEAQFMTYLDADLWFFSSPDAIYEEAKDVSTIIIPHRFPPRRNESAQFGIYNVGWVTFRRDGDGLRLLEWWRQRCLEWCFDRVDEENKRFADQRYLDQFSELSAKVCILAHKGANLAPWNVDGYQLTLRNGAIMVGDEPLLFFHIHGVRTVGRNLYVTPQDVYRSPPDPIQREHIYRPYLKVLRSIERELRPLMPIAAKPLRQLSRRSTTGGLETLKGYLRIARAFARGALMRVPE
jgi:hypothetical protein